jgi:hypothetical protein
MISDTISALIKRADKVIEEIDDLEEITRQRKADLARILEEDIPAVLHENGLTSVDLADGRTILVDTMINVVQVDKKALASWLEANGMGSIVKTNLDFGKSEDMYLVRQALRGLGVDFQENETVHPQTLKKAMRELLEAGGLAPPDDIARVTVFEKARIKGGKE